MNIDKQLLYSYLDGKGDTEERQNISDWFSGLLTNEELRKVSHERWDLIPGDIPVPGYNEDAVHDRIHHLIRLEEARAYHKNRTRIKLIRFFTRVAAIFFIPLVLFTVLNWENSFEGKKAVSDTEIYSPLSTRSSFILPDGSAGWLNGGSYLSFPTRFKGKNRNVRLSGEAYFRVKSSSRKPFIVITDEMRIKVYGTSFNVMAYPDEESIEVTLESGKVELLGSNGKENKRSMGILTPGERGILLRGTHVFRKESVRVDQFTAWKEGRLMFRNEPMDQVIRKMNRWYNVNIIIRDKRLESYNYRATFMDEQLDEVLKIFQRT
ncbi:MAG: FecR domain-containing protein, partial [Bacteroidota bacterium]